MYRSAIEERVEATEVALRLAVDGLDPDDVPAREAVRIFDGLERIVRTATAARTLLARRVEDSMEWNEALDGRPAQASSRPTRPRRDRGRPKSVDLHLVVVTGRRRGAQQRSPPSGPSAGTRISPKRQEPSALASGSRH